MDGIVAPTSAEFAAVRRAGAADANANRVVVQRLGVGPAAGLAYVSQCELAAGDRLALLGWAGGLQPHLRAGAVVVGTVSRTSDGREARCATLQVPGALCGPTLTESEPLLGVSAKAWAGGYSGALAVEMEAFPLAEWAERHGVRFYHVRVVLDEVGEPLPDLAGLLGDDGRVLPARLLRALGRPSAVWGVLRLALRARAVAPVLTGVVGAVCAAWQRGE